MAAADITRVQKAVIELLLASPRASRYSGTVGNNSRYPITQEITDRIVDSDMRFVHAVFDTDDHPYRTGFMAVTAPLATEAYITGFDIGVVGDVQINDGTGTFSGGSRANSREEILEIIACPTLYPNAKRWYFIEKNKIYHSGTSAKVSYPSYTRNDAACQSHDLYTSGIICGAIYLLEKDGGDPIFYNKYGDAANIAEQKIRNRQLWMPDVEELKRQAEAMRKAA